MIQWQDSLGAARETAKGGRNIVLTYIHAPG